MCNSFSRNHQCNYFFIKQAMTVSWICLWKATFFKVTDNWGVTELHWTQAVRTANIHQCSWCWPLLMWSAAFHTEQRHLTVTPRCGNGCSCLPLPGAGSLLCSSQGILKTTLNTTALIIYSTQLIRTRVLMFLLTQEAGSSLGDIFGQHSWRELLLASLRYRPGTAKHPKCHSGK